MRQFGDANALRSVEDSFRQRFLELSGEFLLPNVHLYELLSLARHIHISTLFEKRRHLTETILGVCEERLLQACASQGA